MRHDLPQGLQLRSLDDGTPQDRERLPIFYKEVFTEAGDEDGERLDIVIDDLMNKHPDMSDADIFYVVDGARDDTIVSALTVIPQVWRYDGIDIPVGRVEFVATQKEYRRRGLIRALMNTAHERSASLGHLLQAITGIEYYYRLFGYAMAVNLGYGAMVPFAASPALKRDDQPEFTLRPASVVDIPDIMACDDFIAQQTLLSALRDARMWRYEILERSAGSLANADVQMIVNSDDENVGYVMLAPLNKERPVLGCWRFVVGEKASYLAVYADVLRALKAYVQDRDGSAHMLSLPSSLHETLETLVLHSFGGRVQPFPYAWYLRVADRVRFMQRIAPVPEQRLWHSGAHRYSGTLKIGFYDFTTLELIFEDGRLTTVQQGTTDEVESLDARFPYHMWLNLVFGHRTLAELRHIMPDVYANRTGAVLLDILFPKKRSSVRGLE